MAGGINNQAMPLPAQPAAKPAAPAPSAAPKRDSSRPSQSFADTLAGNDRKAPVTSEASPRDKSGPTARPAGGGAEKPLSPESKAGGAPKASGPSESLRSVAKSQRPVIDGAPVVAFLTGKLEQLTPSAIPELVTGNEFLAEALDEADLGTFLGTPLKVGELLDALDLPQSVKDGAVESGLDLSQVITPNELFKALGVDPQRVFAELKLLKDNLSAGGLGSYVQRAAALTGQSGFRRDMTGPDRPDLPLAERPAPRVPGLPQGRPDGVNLAMTTGSPAAMTAGGLDQSGVALASARPASAPQRMAAPSVGEPAASLEPGALLGAVSGRPLRSAASAGQVELFQEPLAGLAGLTGLIQPPLAVASPSMATETVAPPVQVPGAMVADGAISADSGLTSAPRLHTATYDVWQAMADQLGRSGDVRRMDAAVMGGTPVEAQPAGSAPLTGMELHEALIAGRTGKPLAAGVAQLDSDQSRLTGIPGMAAGPQTPVTRILANGFDVRQAVPMAVAMPEARPDGADAALPLEAVGKYIDTAAAAPVTATSDAGTVTAQRQDLAQRLAFDPRVLGDNAGRAFGGDTGGSGAGSRRDDRERGDRGGSDTLIEALSRGNVMAQSPASGTSAERAGGMSGLGLGGADPALTMSPAERADLMQKVLDRTTTMLHAGGGSARIEVGTRELGNLDLAVNLQDDRLDLRIMTGSDRAREALLGDLNQLRDALSGQNLRLGNVEVGVGGRDSGSGQQNPWSQTGQGFSHQGWQGGQDGRGAWTGGMPGQNFAGSRAPQAVPVRPAALGFVGSTLNNSNGRIAVRA